LPRVISNLTRNEAFALVEVWEQWAMLCLQQLERHLLLIVP